MVKNLNHRFNTEFKLCQGGISLESYENSEEFANVTSVGSMPRKMRSLGNPVEWPVDDVDLFQIPWLSLRREKTGDGDSLFLFLHEDTILQFFETMNFEGMEIDFFLLREIIFRFVLLNLRFLQAIQKQLS